MVRAAFFACLLIAAGADDDTMNKGEATALLQSRMRTTEREDTKGLDDADTGSCADKEEFCFDRTSMSGKCLRHQPLWHIPSFGIMPWNCQRAAKFCRHDLWKYDVTRCCPGVCTDEELYRAEAPVWDGGGIGGCQASKETCADCAGNSNWCLHSRKHWSPSHTCENSKSWCTDTKWSQDMLECCPGVCHTAANSTGGCQLTGCMASDGTCTDCNDYSDKCLHDTKWGKMGLLKKIMKGHPMTCETARDKGYCNDKKKGPDMEICCPGMCDTTAYDDGVKGWLQCGRLGCQTSESICTDNKQNSDKCIAKRRGKKVTCVTAKNKGMCTRNYGTKEGRKWIQDMLECCPKECGAAESTNGEACAYTGCQASDKHCGDCNDNSDRCMQEFKGSYKWTCKKARDAGYCSIRDGSNWKKRKEAMNNCCPGICKGPYDEEDLIPAWAICRGGSGKDEEQGLEEHPLEPEPADMD